MKSVLYIKNTNGERANYLITEFNNLIRIIINANFGEEMLILFRFFRIKTRQLSRKWFLTSASMLTNLNSNQNRRKARKNKSYT